MAGFTQQQRIALRAAKVALEQHDRNTICFRKDGGQYRVWRPFWFGDQFEIVDRSTWVSMQAAFKRLGFTIEEDEE